MCTVTLSDAKARLPGLLAEVSELGERYIITRSGRPSGVLLSVEEYEGLCETLEILADAELAESIREGLQEANRGQTISHEELWDELDGEVHEVRRGVDP